VSSVYLYQLLSIERVVFPDWISSWIYNLLSFSSAWCWLFSILGFAFRFLSVDRPWLRHANEGVLPFYILHQTVLLAVGYFIMKWRIHDALKWALVFTISFIFIITIYTLFIRNIDLLRLLFGMKTEHPLFAIFRKKMVLIALFAIYVGMIVFAGAHQATGITANYSSNALMYDPQKDVLVTSEFITDQGGDQDVSNYLINHQPNDSPCLRQPLCLWWRRNRLPKPSSPCDKLGYETEGVRKEAILRDGDCYDSILMGKFIGQQG
jgi:hypothetical protein